MMMKVLRLKPKRMDHTEEEEATKRRYKKEEAMSILIGCLIK
jgi:hypothetical protein